MDLCYIKDMGKMLKYLTTDSRSFKDLIEGKYLYVDKTGYIYDMLKKGSPSKYWFLSRPRRFGKSLTIDTLANIFSGNKELFKGTCIYDRYDFESYPVIRFSMNNVSTYSEEEFLYSLKHDLILPIAREYGVSDSFPVEATAPSSWLNYLISAMAEKYGKKVVILIDEYDYPLLDTVRDESYARIKTRLESFYGVLKPREEDIRFCFITGITRFPQVSIFSKLNNLLDISNDPVYASVCGYTDEELDYYFTPYMEKYYEENGVEGEERKEFRRRIKEYYDGYRFSIRNEVTVYNPVSIGKFFIGGCSFENFWISTGAQSIVKEIVEANAEVFTDRKEFSVPISKTKVFEVERLFTSPSDQGAVLSYLLQAGYLTIRREEVGDYVLSYPNLEVKDAMNAAVLSSYGLEFESERVAALRDAFQEERTEEIIKILYNSFLTYPYHLTLDREKGFQIAVYSALRMCVDVKAEEVTNTGRIDIAVRVRKDLVYIIELKLDESGDKALSQIKEKRYYEKYTSEGCRVHLLGINFSSKERNISDWKEEIIS